MFQVKIHKLFIEPNHFVKLVNYPQNHFSFFRSVIICMVMSPGFLLIIDLIKLIDLITKNQISVIWFLVIKSGVQKRIDTQLLFVIFCCFWIYLYIYFFFRYFVSFWSIFLKSLFSLKTDRKIVPYSFFLFQPNYQE